MRGYALNKMCFSFNSAANREKFRGDEEAYMRAYGLNETRPRRSASATCSASSRPAATSTTSPNSRAFSGSTCRISARPQTGMTKDAFKARLVAQNDQPETI